MNTRARFPGFLAAAGLAVGLTVAGCESQPEPVAEPRAPLIPPMDLDMRPVSESFARVGGPIDSATSAALVNTQRLRAGRRNAAEQPRVVDNEPGLVKQVRLSARDMAPIDFVRIVVGEYLDRSFIVHPDIAGAGKGITLDIDAEMTERDLLDLLGSIATLYGWTIDDSGESIVIGRAADMARDPGAPILKARAALGDERTGMRVFRLEHIPAREASDALRDLISEGARVVNAGRMLVVVDRLNQLNRFDDLLAALDAAPFAGSEIWTYKIAYPSPSDAARTLGAIATASNLNRGDNTLVSFIPIPNSDRLMVISRDPSVLQLVAQWVRMVDQPPGESSRQRYLYRIQHYEPQQLDTLVKSVFSERMESSRDDPAEEGMRIVLDTDEDLMIIYANPRDYAEFVSLVSRVDVARQQVELQSIIAEVRLENSLQWGVEYFLQQSYGEGILEAAGNLANLGPANPAGSLAFLATDGFAVIQALSQETDVTILSNPRLFVRDKDQASFQVGGEVPVIRSNIDSDVQQGGDTRIRQEIEYRETGLTLDMQPRINEQGDVTLNIQQTIRNVAQTTSGGIDSPQFDTRVIDTTVTVPHGRTLLIGGIINSDDSTSINKIPLLGDIPFVGKLFQNIRNEVARTELVLAVRPVVINDPGEGEQRYSDFMVSAGEVENALRRFALEYVPAERRDPARGDQPAPTGERSDPGDAPSAPESGDGSPDRSESDAVPMTSLREIAAALPDDEQQAAVAAFLRSLLRAAEGAPGS